MQSTLFPAQGIKTFTAKGFTDHVSKTGKVTCVHLSVCLSNLTSEVPDLSAQVSASVGLMRNSRTQVKVEE